jgi:predicted metal-dependent HD superfamily phosphohydrolase
VVTTVAAATAAATPPEGAHLVLAAFYHDVVHDPRRGDNEALSASRARDELVACGVGPIDAARVAEAVMATAHLGDGAVAPPGTGPLLDADLAVLGSNPVRYRRYAAEVRAEYAHVGDDDWRIGRAAVLRHLQGQALFVTPWGRARYEPAARDNLRWELEELAAGRVPGWSAIAPDRAGVSRCDDRLPGGAS